MSEIKIMFKVENKLFHSSVQTAASFADIFMHADFLNVSNMHELFTGTATDDWRPV